MGGCARASPEDQAMKRNTGTSLLRRKHNPTGQFAPQYLQREKTLLAFAIAGLTKSWVLLPLSLDSDQAAGGVVGADAVRCDAFRIFAAAD